jgi:hypothetical protein
MPDANIPSGPPRDPEGSGGHGPEGLAGYRADRDDFSRLLYLVYQEVRARKEGPEEGAA